MHRVGAVGPKFSIAISPRGFPQLLTGIAVALVLAHVALQAVHHFAHELPWLFTDLFDVDEEESFPTWFSAVLLWAACILLIAIACGSVRTRDRQVYHWWGLAVGFGVLSMDEVVGVHETVNTITDYSWTIPAAMLLLALAMVYLPFVLRLPPRTRCLCVLSGAVFVGGAVGVERVADFYIGAFGDDGFGYELMTALEEGLEMLGVVIFIGALLDYMVSPERPVVALVCIRRPAERRAGNLPARGREPITGTQSPLGG